MEKPKNGNGDTPKTDDLVIGPLDVRQALIDMGINPYLSSPAVPTLFLTPAESDPSSSMTMIIVQGIQKCLKELGYILPRNGLMDAATQSAIAQVAGRNWPAVPWMHIYKICRRNKLWGLKPRSQVSWKQTQRTAIGESISLGATVSPLDAAIVYTIPSTAIDCVGAGTAEYCYGKTSLVTAKFKDLQATLGVAMDGKVGPRTAAAAGAKAKEMFLDRYNRKMLPDDANHLQAVYVAWEKYQRPFVVAASADKTAAIIKKYGGAVAGAVAKVQSVVASLVTPEDTGKPAGMISSFVTSGYGLAAAAGLGVLAFFVLKPKKKKGRR